MKHICEQCDNPFEAPPSQGARFCDRDCYDKSRTGLFECDFCGSPFKRFKSRAKRSKLNFCSRNCHRDFIDSDVKNQPAFEKGTASYRKIVEKKIGRKLKSNEIIHHLDGDRTNNSFNNLFITNRMEHTKFHPENGYQRGHKQFNTGRTRFRKGSVPWNKGK